MSGSRQGLSEQGGDNFSCAVVDMAVLETVPETVLFRGWHDNDAARGAQRTLLLRNRGPQLQALVTQPLSGLFELRTAAPTDAREPEFFYTFTMPANSTVKVRRVPLSHGVISACMGSIRKRPRTFAVPAGNKLGLYSSKFSG